MCSKEGMEVSFSQQILWGDKKSTKFDMLLPGELVKYMRKNKLPTNLYPTTCSTVSYDASILQGRQAGNNLEASIKNLMPTRVLVLQISYLEPVNY